MSMGCLEKERERPSVFESAVNWCKWHLAVLSQVKEESKPNLSTRRELLAVHTWERGIVAPGNVAVVKPVAVVENVNVPQLETGLRRDNPMLYARRKADQRPGTKAVAHSDTEEASRAVCGSLVISNKDNGKWL